MKGASIFRKPPLYREQISAVLVAERESSLQNLFD